MARHPDLIVMYYSGSNAAAAEHFRRLGVPVLQLSVDRLADVARIAGLLGSVTGHRSSADSLATAMDADLARATAHLDPGTRRPKVLIVAWDQPPMAIGGGSFLSELVDRAGGVNVFEDIQKPSAQISIEAVVRRDPDVLLVSSDGPPSLASRPEWQVVPAVRHDRFIHVSSSAFNRPSPRAPAAIRELASKLGSVPR
jgi:ABC-type Fe3+-hydroxamate transport system substrate-binding protein